MTIPKHETDPRRDPAWAAFGEHWRQQRVHAVDWHDPADVEHVEAMSDAAFDTWDAFRAGWHSRPVDAQHAAPAASVPARC